MGSIKQSLLEQSLPFLPIRVENRNWKNRLLLALISNLGHAPHLAHNSLGNRSRFPRLFAFSSKPGPCPKSRDSPIISAGQKIFSRKRGGGDIAQDISRRESGFSAPSTLIVPSPKKRRNEYSNGPEKVGFWISRALRALGLFFC